MPSSPDPRRGLVCAADLAWIAALLAGGAGARVIPRSFDATVVRGLLGLRLALAPGRVGWLDARMEAALADKSGYTSGQTARACLRMRAEDAWGRCRALKPFAWKPAVEWDGLDRVHAALAEGRGVIAWSMRLSSATAIKMAFHQAGLPLVHLSRVSHGAPSETRVGLRYSAPLFCRAENPYLRERVQIPLEGAPRYLQVLKKRLAENACVSIFGEHRGRQNVEVSVLGRKLAWAMGAPSLAWSTRAVLLTVHPHRIGPAAYRICVDEPIAVDYDAPRKDAATAAVQEFARRLERLVAAHPADWQGWFYPELAAPGER